MADTTGLAALVYNLHQRLGSLATDLADLTQFVRAHIEAEAERGTAAPAPVWFGLSEAERNTRLRELAGWVDQHLRATYRDYLQDVLQDCWAQHPGAVWELGDLYAEWTRVYGGDPPNLPGALAWHDRWLPGVRARLEVTMRGCTETTGCRHQRPQVTGWGAR